MVRSLFSGVSGLKTHQQKMDVIGNNIANVNTTGFKTSVTTFQEVYYQTKKNGSAGSNLQGGVNPSQVGYGTKLGAIGQVMGQSGFTYSDSVYDCALSGDGFFQVMDEAGNIFYSRAGVFNVDNAGNLVDSNGNMVLGVSGDATGVDASSNRITFVVPEVLDNEASYSKTITYKGSTYPLTVSADTATPDGNISVGFTVGNSDYAYMSGNKLVVQLNEKNDYTNLNDLEDAVTRACENGGVSIDGVLPLHFELDTVPPAADIPATTATNTMKLDDGTTKASLTFTTVNAGEYANNYTINLRYSKNAADADETMIIVAMEVTVNDSKSIVSFCMSAITMDQIMKKFSAKFSSGKRAGSPTKETERKENLMSTLSQSELTVTAVLDDTVLTLRDVLNLQVNDIIPLNKPIIDNVQLKVGSTCWFDGKLGTLNGKKAFRIDNILKN